MKSLVALALTVATVAAHADAGDWRRTRFQPGGGDAQLFYLVFGSWKRAPQVSREKYRTRGLPRGVELVAYPIADESCQSLAGSEGYRYLRKDHPEVERAVQRASMCVRIFGEVADPATLEYLRDVVGTVTALVDTGGETTVLDVKSARWWNAGDWRKLVFEPATLDPRAHFMIFWSEEDDGRGWWLHTRGLRKFGRPDLSVHHVPTEEQQTYAYAVTKIADAQIDGRVFADGTPITGKTLPPDLVLRRAGSMDDVEFNNVHFELTRTKF